MTLPLEEIEAKAREENGRLNDRNVEVSVLAHKWMVAHDSLKDGLPYDYLSPADVPALTAENARLRGELGKADVLADIEFLNGLKLGWNCGVTGDHQKYQTAKEGRSREIRAARQALEQQP